MPNAALGHTRGKRATPPLSQASITLTLFAAGNARGTPLTCSSCAGLPVASVDILLVNAQHRSQRVHHPKAQVMPDLQI